MCVLEDESITLQQAGLSENTVLCLERGGKPLPNTLSLRVCLVTGNDTALKTNPKAPGTRGVVVECEVSASSTVRSLRDLAGALLLSLTPGWTDPPPLPPVPALSVPVEDSSGDPFQKVSNRRGKDTRVPPPVAPALPSSHGGRNGARNAPRAAAIPPPPPQPMRFDPLGGLVAIKPPRPSSSSFSSDSALSSTGADDVCEEKRLRRTNAFEECGDLLDETEAAHTAHGWRGNKSHGLAPEAALTGGSMKPPGAKGEGWKDRESASEEEVPITLEAAGLRSGDLLLFEDGPLPVGGRAKLMVYLWVKDIAVLNATPTALPLATLPDQPVNGQKEKVTEAETEHHGSSRRRDGRFRDGKGKSKPEAPKRAEERVVTTIPAPVPVIALVASAPMAPVAANVSCKQGASNAINAQASKITPVEPSAEEKEKEKGADAVDKKEEEDDEKLNALASALKQRSRHLLPLFVSSPLCMPEENTLLQLQKAVLTGLQGEAVAAALRTVYPTWKG